LKYFPAMPAAISACYSTLLFLVFCWLSWKE